MVVRGSFVHWSTVDAIADSTCITRFIEQALSTRRLLYTTRKLIHVTSYLTFFDMFQLSVPPVLLVCRVQMVPTAYPVCVARNSPVLNGLRPVDTPCRSSQLPSLYIYDGDHPFHRVKPPGCHTYVYLVDSSEAGKLVFEDISEAQNVPAGPISCKCTPGPCRIIVLTCMCPALKGYTELCSGDALFARPITGGGDVRADCLQILVGVRCVSVQRMSKL